MKCHFEATEAAVACHDPLTGPFPKYYHEYRNIQVLSIWQASRTSISGKLKKKILFGFSKLILRTKIQAPPHLFPEVQEHQARQKTKDLVVFRLPKFMPLQDLIPRFPRISQMKEQTSNPHSTCSRAEATSLRYINFYLNFYWPI